MKHGQKYPALLSVNGQVSYPQWISSNEETTNKNWEIFTVSLMIWGQFRSWVPHF